MTITHYQCSEICRESYKQLTYSTRDVEVLVKPIDGDYVVAVRGTEAKHFYKNWNILDIVRNLLAFPWYDKRVGWAHYGYLKAAQKAAKNKVFRKKGKYYLTGHSLGGAVATLIAAILKHYDFNVELVTFGCPGVLASGHAKLKPTTTQYVYKNDVVPSLLTRTIYKHINIKQIGKRGGIKNTRDHDINNYITALKNI